jgi:DNA-binding CsgD family transcriptional regulator
LTTKSRSGSPVRNCCRCGREFRCEGGDRVCAACRKPRSGSRALSPNLSFREKQVIDLISQAKLNKEIAHELHLTEGTIKEYLNRIFRKLGITNRTELAIWALTQKSAPAKGVVASLWHPPVSAEPVVQASHSPASGDAAGTGKPTDVFQSGGTRMERRTGGRAVRVQ